MWAVCFEVTNQKTTFLNILTPWRSRCLIKTMIYNKKKSVSKGLSLEVLYSCRLSAHESDGGCPARKTQTDSSLRTPNEHHCWCHHRPAFHQKQGDSLLSFLSAALILLLTAACLIFVSTPHHFHLLRSVHVLFFFIFYLNTRFYFILFFSS